MLTFSISTVVCWFGLYIASKIRGLGQGLGRPLFSAATLELLLRGQKTWHTTSSRWKETDTTCVFGFDQTDEYLLQFPPTQQTFWSIWCRGPLSKILRNLTGFHNNFRDPWDEKIILFESFNLVIAVRPWNRFVKAPLASGNLWEQISRLHRWQRHVIYALDRPPNLYFNAGN